MKNCHACITGSYKPYVNSDGGQVKDVHVCDSCGHIFREYFGDPALFHRDKYRAGAPLFPTSVRKKYSSALLSKISHFLNKEQACLEIGSGDGLFASILKGYVGTVECCEVDKKLSQQCKDLGLVTHSCDFNTLKANKKYDVLIAVDVLEHFVSLEEFRDNAINKCSSTIVLQVPIDRGIIPPNPTFDGHSHYFTLESMRKLFSKTDFELSFHCTTKKRETAHKKELICVFQR